MSDKQHYKNSKLWGKAYAIDISSKIFRRKSSFEINRLYKSIGSLDISKKSRVLDIGCGKGIIANFFLNIDKQEYCGIDISNDLVKICANDYGPHFIVADGLHLPIKNESFDIIIFNAVIHHIVGIKDLLKECNRILCQNGIIFIQEPNRYSFQILTLGYKAPFKFIYGDCLDPNERPLNPKYIQRYLQNLGFEIYSIGINIVPIKLLVLLPFPINNFLDRLDSMIVRIFRFPLIGTANFLVIAKKKR